MINFYVTIVLVDIKNRDNKEYTTLLKGLCCVCIHLVYNTK